jgi:hypothetical protein
LIAVCTIGLAACPSGWVRAVEIPVLQTQNKQVKVSGTVRDDIGEPLPGAYIIVRGSTRYNTTTDADGNFQITVPEGSVLVFSYLGYINVEKAAGDHMEIVMEPDAQKLDALVVVGYTKQNMRDVSASVAKIDMQAIEHNTSVSLASMLAGQLQVFRPLQEAVFREPRIPGLLSAVTTPCLFKRYYGDQQPALYCGRYSMPLQDIAGYNVTDNDFLSSLNPQIFNPLTSSRMRQLPLSTGPVVPTGL